MLESKPSQFTLSPEGKILWQEKLNNPLPGVEVASLIKGDHPLRPKIGITTTSDVDRDKLKDTLNFWFNTHIAGVLESLMALGISPEPAPDEAFDPVAMISRKVFDGLGIVPREDLEEHIQKLDADRRVTLRGKKIRLGPILVFIPALNKPAAVRLRGLLWCLYNDQPLPAKTPADGVVSCKIDDTNANEAFYRSVGYPLFGGRAVRIDMLDRVISSVYDSAKDGIFEAQHQMAEWLGTPIEDLYKILEAMGHRKIEESVQEQAVVVAEPASVIEPEAKPENAEAQAEQNPEEAKPVQIKPALAKFRLKRGKAFQKERPRSERKPFVQNQKSEEAQREKFKSEPKEQKTFEKKFDRHKSKNDKKKHEKKHERPRGSVTVLEAKKKEADSPFAILQNLVVKSDG